MPGDDKEEITKAILSFADAGADLIICTGGMSVDPDDRTPGGIRDTGAKIVTYGAPVLPGAMLLVAAPTFTRLILCLGKGLLCSVQDPLGGICGSADSIDSIRRLVCHDLRIDRAPCRIKKFRCILICLLNGYDLAS